MNTSRFATNKIPSHHVRTWGSAFKNIGFISRLLTPMEKKVIRIAVAVVMMTGLVWGGYWFFAKSEAIPAPGGTYVEGMVGAVNFVNPVLATTQTDLDISRLVFDGLMRVDKNKNLEPSLAEHYEINEAQTEYTFFLRQGVRWHDGQEFDADDVLFTFQTITNQQWNSPYYNTFSGIVVEKVDQYTVKFVLPESFNPFLSSLDIGIIPQHIWEPILTQEGASIGLVELNKKPIGTGPFQYNSLVRSGDGVIKSYHLERNGGYFQQAPFIEKLVFKFFSSSRELPAALDSRQIDGISYVPPDIQADVCDSNTVNLYAFGLPEYRAVFYHVTKPESHLADVEVRRALSYLIDKPRLVDEVLDGQGKVIHAPILEGFVGYHPEPLIYNYDPMKAAEIFTAAGWVLNEEDGYRYKDGKLLEIGLTTNQSEEYLQVAEIITTAWEEAGVKTLINSVSNEELRTRWFSGRDYEAVLYGQFLGTGSDPDPYAFWHSSQAKAFGFNLSNVKNREVDQLLEEARKDTDSDQRQIKYVTFQNLLINDIVAASFLYSPNYLYAVDEKVKGIDQLVINSPDDRFAGITEWYIKTKRVSKDR